MSRKLLKFTKQETKTNAKIPYITMKNLWFYKTKTNTCLLGADTLLVTIRSCS